PVTIVWGAKDVAISRPICIDGIGDYFARGSQMVVIERAGHWSPQEKEGREVFEEVVAWAVGGEEGVKGLREVLSERFVDGGVKVVVERPDPQLPKPPNRKTPATDPTQPKVLVWTTLRIAVKPLDLAVPTSQTDVVEATDSKPATIFPALDLVVAVIGIAVIAIGTTVSGMIVVFEHIRIGIGS
ncbi:hypothetical protein LTS18_010724, partial [Coniosporium uncinatum]